MPTTPTPAKLKTAIAQHAKLRTQYRDARAAVETSDHPHDSPAAKKLADTRDRIGHKLQLAADKLTAAGYTLTNMDSEPVAPTEPEPEPVQPVTITLADVTTGEVIRVGRKGLTGRIWGPRVLGAAPVKEGEEAAADAGRSSGCTQRGKPARPTSRWRTSPASTSRSMAATGP